MMEQGEHRMAILRNEDEPLPIRDSSAGERFQAIVQQQTDERAGEGAGDNGRKEGGS
jgi:hypothetical protein